MKLQMNQKEIAVLCLPDTKKLHSVDGTRNETNQSIVYVVVYNNSQQQQPDLMINQL